MTNQIIKNIIDIEEEIFRLQPSKQKINLLLVTKYATIAQILPAIEHGCLHFGENRLQDAKVKWTELKAHNLQIKLHFIGHLQKNKAKEVVKLFDVIQTLDSFSLAKELAKEMQKQKKQLEIFIQVNIGEESQKAGIKPSEVADFILQVKKDYNIEISGLMCIPPKDEVVAPYFSLLEKIATENNIKNLSMGMSGDYAIAIKLGANYVRIGSRIFGKN